MSKRLKEMQTNIQTLNLDPHLNLLPKRFCLHTLRRVSKLTLPLHQLLMEDIFTCFYLPVLPIFTQSLPACPELVSVPTYRKFSRTGSTQEQSASLSPQMEETANNEHAF